MGDRSRGYKRQFNPGATGLEIPKTTKWRRSKNQDQPPAELIQADTEAGPSSSQDSSNDFSHSESPIETVRPSNDPSPSDNDDSSDDIHGSDDRDDSEKQTTSDDSSDEVGDDTDNDDEDDDDNDDDDGEDDEDDFWLSDDSIPDAPPNLTHEEMSKKYNLDDVLDPGNSGMTKFEVLFLLLNLSNRFGFNNKAVKALIKFVNLLLDQEVIPPSDFIFNKIFESPLPKNFHFFCPDCFYYFGMPRNKTDTSAKCPTCKTDVKLKRSHKSKHFFLHMPLKDQIKMRLEEKGDDIINYRKNRIQNPDEVSDAFDSGLFAELKDKVQMTDSDITVNLNTDGSPVFKSTTKSLWPVQCRINEIVPEKRFSFENLMVTGLWFSKTVHMATYLRPFIEELKSLSTDGIRWYNKKTNKFITTRVFLLQCIVDTVAKAKLMYMKQFNAYLGCYLCYSPGVDGTEGEADQVQIRYSSEEYDERTDESIRADMQKAHETGEVEKGMKGISLLAALWYFCMTYGISLDYMHSHLLGVVKYMCTKLWTNPEFSDCDFYLSKALIKLIDERLLKLRPPKDISRDIRGLSEKVHWKANEWRSWTFFYAPLCLKDILPARYYKHFCLLSKCLYILNQSSIPRIEFIEVGELLREFVSQFQELYGLRYMTYNVHATSHLTRSVIMSGPKWVDSLFVYEAAQGYLVNLVHGTNGVEQQIARKFTTSNSISYFVSQHPNTVQKEKVMNFCDSINNFTRFKKFSTCGTVTVIGSIGPLFIPSNEEGNLLHLNHINDAQLLEVKKIICSGSVFISPSHSTGNKKDDSVFMLPGGRGFAKIDKFFVTSLHPELVYAFVKPLRIDPNRALAPDLHIKVLSEYEPFGDLELVRASQIQEKCLFLSYDDNLKCVCRFPNKFEKD